MATSVITGTGASIPEAICMNEAFLNKHFYEETGTRLENAPELIIEKFRAITGIRERRYADPSLHASDLAAAAGRQALKDSGADPESIDLVIVAHNFGDISHNSTQSRNVPSLANRVKHLLGIRNPSCVCYDILFGCPGWVQAMIVSHAHFKASMAKKALLIGAETLSRVIDPSDRDSMIFSDGAGACLLEYKETEPGNQGILGACAQSHSVDELNYINMGPSYCPSDDSTLYMKMKGRKVYEYAIRHVPLAMKKCLDDSGVDIRDISKIFIHQANEKMDEEMVRRLFRLYGINEAPANIMPMSVQWLGNSSVATVPTLYHLVRTGQMEEHQISAGDVVLFASVGAGMNINAVCYRV